MLAAASLAIGFWLGSFDFAHYAAPAFGLVMLATMAGFRSLRQWRPRGYSCRLSVTRVLPLALVVGSVVPLTNLPWVADTPAFMRPVAGSDTFFSLNCRK